MRELTVRVVAILGVVLSAALAVASDGPPAEVSQAFDRLKSLAGTWDAVTPGGPGTVRYRVGSAGSVVIEELFPGTPHEMMTVYHLDGAELVATHYCSAGNQPRFKLDRSSATPERLQFAFNGGSNMRPEDGHIHEGWIRFVDPNHVEAEWVFWQGGKPEHAASFVMTRRSNG